MIKRVSEDKKHTNQFFKYRFPLWLTIFFLILVSIPILIVFDHLLLAKFLGISCLILIIVALRLWLRKARINSTATERYVLNKNQIFDLERKFRFLKNMSNSERQIIYQRTGLLLAELDFISTNNNISIEYGIDLAFNFTLLLLDKEYKSLKGLVIDLTEYQFNDNNLNGTPKNFPDGELSYADYKQKLVQSELANKFMNSLA